MRPSDWYMMIMNEVDEKLEAAGLDTRIVFISYVDTLWGPEKFAIKNPKRFSLLYAPISRSYCSSFNENSVVIDIGINFDEKGSCGDVDYEAVADKVAAITPVPGGVGTVTSSVLLSHVLPQAF